MSIRDSSLPRVDLFRSDGHLGVVATQPTTDSLLIIGPAIDGPTERIVKLNAVPNIERLFGPIVFNSNYTGPNGETAGYSGNAIMKALREAQRGGAADVRFLRVGGTKATGTLTVSTKTLNATAIYGGRIYNQVTIAFTAGETSGSVTVSQPDIKGGDFTLSYTDATVAEIIAQINTSKKNGTVRLELGSMLGSTLAKTLDGTITLSGGTDGTQYDDLAEDKSDLYDALTDEDTGVFAFLEDEEADVILLAGFYLDDQVDDAYTDSIAFAFSDFLAERSLSYPTIGVIGVRPLQGEATRAAIVDHVEALTTADAASRGTGWINAGPIMRTGFVYGSSDLPETLDGGGFLQVVAADVYFSDPNLNLYVENAAALYAGVISSRAPYNPTTHAPVPGIAGVPYYFRRSELNALVEGVGRDVDNDELGGPAYVTIRRQPSLGTVFTRGVTAAQRSSAYKDLHMVRLVNAVHKGVKNIAAPFLGRPNNFQIKTSLKTQVKTFLDAVADQGALLGGEGIGYEFEIVDSNSRTSQVLGVITINLKLRPAYEITVIQVNVQLEQ